MGSTIGVLFNKSQTSLLQCPGGKVGNITIPNSVTSIGYAAFNFCTSLTSITIGNSVTSIGQEAFYGCTNLTSVYFLGNKPAIGTGVFDNANQVIVYYLPGTTGWGGKVWWSASQAVGPTDTAARYELQR
ncbi:MAG: leucine-rich repeat domain-containing protein [Pedosphaera sp.]|nr:leucine-rich repeat domain-containing protein [Pedosphaera sp.]